MSVFKKWGYALYSIFSKKKIEDDLNEEMKFHIDMETKKNIELGLEPSDAERRAKIAFGGVESIKEICRRSYGGNWTKDALNDCSYASRYLASRKGFALSILLTLGICLGANVTFFTALNSLVFEPLPFKDSSEIVEIYRTDKNSGNSKLGGNLALLNEYSQQEEIFESTAFFNSRWMNLQIDEYSSRVNAIFVSNDFFETIGLYPKTGSLFSNTSQDNTIVLSHSLQQQLIPQDDSPLGSTVLLNGNPLSVIGIAPSEAEFVDDWAGVFVKIDALDQISDPQDEALRSTNEGTIWARLKEGVSTEKAATQLSLLEARFRESASESYKSFNNENLRSINVSTVQYERSKGARSRLFLLNGAALLVLIIGCVNISNLLLSQTNARKHEFWIRHTIGATKGRIIRQCLTEIGLLATAGWLCSIAICLVNIRLLDAHSSELFQINRSISIGASTLLYSLAITCICTIAIGLVVALKSSSNEQATNSGNSSRNTSDRSATTLRSFLSIGQTALTLALLIGIGLLVKSFHKVVTQDLGFDGENVTTARIHLPEQGYSEGEQREQFKDRLLQKLRAIPGVEFAGLSSTIPSYGFPDSRVSIHADSGEPRTQMGRSYFSYISPGYLNSMGITLLEGRDFEQFDESGWQDPMIVDERFAQMFFPNESAIGKRIRLGGPPRNPNNWPIIVGVAETSKHTSVDNHDSLPLVYRPLKSSWVNEFNVFIESKQSSNEILKILNESVAQIDPSLPLFRFGNMNSILAESLIARKGLLLLSLGMGAIALLLAAVGMYGTAAFRISQKLREFAIRMAIGANQSQLIFVSVRHDLQHSLIGMGIGFTAAFFGSRLLSSWLYDIEAFDWQVFLALTVLVLFVSLISSYLPARIGIEDRKIKASLR